MKLKPDHPRRRTLFACQKCGEEFGEGEENQGRCPHCNKGYGDPIGECPDCPDSPDGHHHAGPIGSDEDLSTECLTCYFCGEKACTRR